MKNIYILKPGKNAGKAYGKGGTALSSDDFLTLAIPETTLDILNLGDDGFNTYISLVDLVTNGGKALISGGAVTVEAGTYNITVQEAVWVINGESYTAPTTTFTLTGADAINDRVDLIVGKIDLNQVGVGYFEIKEGIEGLPAITPRVDNELTDIAITHITVDNNTTTPSELINTVIYEDNGAESTTGVVNKDAGTTIDFDSVTAVYSGAKCLRVDAFKHGDIVEWVMPAPFDATLEDNHSFWIASTAGSWTQNGVVEIAIFNGDIATTGVPASNWVQISGKANQPYGFNSGNTDVWQEIVIPKVAFGAVGTADRYILRKNDGKTQGDDWKFDLFQSQRGIIPPPTIEKTLLSEFINDVGFITLADLPPTSALIDNVTVGENVVDGDSVYLSNDGKYWKTNASAASTSSTEVRWVLATILADAVGSVLIKGQATTTGLVAGDTYWLDESSGNITNDTSGFAESSYVRYVGTAVSATQLEYNPDKTSIRRDGLEYNGIKIETTTGFAFGDETSDVEVGIDKVTFRFPFAITILDTWVTLTTAGITSTMNVDVKINTVTIYSTVITVDTAEESSSTAAIPAVLSTTTAAAFDEFAVNIDQVHTTPGKGPKFWIKYTKN
jgi:hypothetical protein